ncbi:MAG: helix-turn-helix transcriptional regulator [Alphaproteobacteria bacterium]|nr:helix-turn-helix transcriptional regulator [Alphaproteobacteria bacterium]
MLADTSDLERRIAQRLRDRRELLGLSLEQLAALSGVSRAMIARVERRESSPTAGLLGKLCNGLGITLSAVMADIEQTPHTVSRRTEQLVWQDPETKYNRRLVSPPSTGSGIEIVEIELPVGARVAYDRSRALDYDQHVLVQDGALTLTIGSTTVELHPGDCAQMTLDDGLVFANKGTVVARYLVINRRTERALARGERRPTREPLVADTE